MLWTTITQVNELVSIEDIREPILNFVRANPLFKGFEKEISEACEIHKDISHYNTIALQSPSPKSFGRTNWTVTHDRESRFLYIPEHCAESTTRLLFGLICRNPPKFDFARIQVSDRQMEQNLTWRYDLNYGHIALFSEPYLIKGQVMHEVVLDFHSPGKDHIEPIGVLIGYNNYQIGSEIRIDIWNRSSSELAEPEPIPLPENPVVQAIKESKGQEGNEKINALVDSLTKSKDNTGE